MKTNSSSVPRTFLVIGIYMLVRAWIYHRFPAHTPAAWLFRDTVMSVPRFVGFMALLTLNRKPFLADAEWRFTNPAKAFLLAIAPIALWLVYFNAGQGSRYAPTMILVGLFNSALAGLFEEYAFRGPLLIELRQITNVFIATLLSSLLFVGYHYQALSPKFWGEIFLVGVIYANLRFRGVSLAWLVLIHAVIDGCYFLFPNLSPPPFSFAGLILHGGLLVYAIVTLPLWIRTKPAPSNSETQTEAPAKVI